jgi:hypothetical protein
LGYAVWAKDARVAAKRVDGETKEVVWLHIDALMR